MVIAASAEDLYDRVADVGKMGEYSPEATGALRAPSVLSAGDRFIGTNRRGVIRWPTVCTVLEARRGEAFAFNVDVGPVAVSKWSYAFEPVEGGTRVMETWEDRRAGVLGAAVKAVGKVIIPGDRSRHNRLSILTTLRALKQAAESNHTQS